MNTIALRFGEHFAPSCGTIAAHNEIIEQIGYTWYGKIGAKVSESLLKEILKADDPKFLLINSGKASRYWVHITDYRSEKPEDNEYPSYYGDKVNKMNTWLKVTKIDPAPKDIMSKCYVISSGAQLGEVSKHSMSPYFKISYNEEE